MNHFFDQGYAIDALIALLLVEIVVVKRLRDGFPAASLLAGLGLLLAWRFAHGGAPWPWTLAMLAAAGAAHAWDVWQRWSAPPIR